MPKIRLIYQLFSRDIADLRILQSSWLRTFWLTTQEPEFPQVWDLCRHKANKMNFKIEKLKKNLIFSHLKPVLPISTLK